MRMRGGSVRQRCGRFVRGPTRAQTCAVLLTLVGALAGCTVGPDYIPASAPVPTTFKELKGWKIAKPSDDLPRGDWWTYYHDAKLDFLIKQVEISNQNVAVQAAAYEQARAVIREAQAALFPTVTGSYTGTRSFLGPGVSGSAGVASGPVVGHGIYT